MRGKFKYFYIFYLNIVMEEAKLNASKIEKEIENLKEFYSKKQYKEFWSHTKKILRLLKHLNQF